jgi:N-acetylglucosamine-6-sulfatase
VHTPSYVDGRSLQPVLEEDKTAWRSAILLEAAASYSPAYRSIRTSDGRKYVEYASGQRELYHLGHDPYELRDTYDPDDQPATLAKRLKKLRSCAADSCRAAENGQ